MIAQTRVPLIFGTMTLGLPGSSAVRVTDKKEAQDILDTFFGFGHKELDTARIYCGGTTEQLLSQLDLQEATIDTKVYPVKPGDHTPHVLRETFQTSLKALNRQKVRVLYLHAPDRSVPFEDTLKAINELYREGLFEMLGLSNYAAWEVAEVVGICRAKGYVTPKIYQVMYNAITREMEAELLPCARKFGLRLVIYNPLAGGLFAGKIESPDTPVTEGRFGPGRQGDQYRARYLQQGQFEALKYLKGVAAEHHLRLTEIALRWCQHHSKLTPEDGVILGASTASQLRQNCEDSLKGPLPDAVVHALDEARRIVLSHGSAPSYWR
ncbi:Aldo/keto reductase [Armillaria novae-zelandiae]|uniref:Aldo/keto reductase n=1 Tax=Armillaria novae-zelandiae TaxID=153914 RepID=A0AA39PHY1_9AGAR|nr:Aldo/keto reductase [Armillaria novae-zelandiae]